MTPMATLASGTLSQSRAPDLVEVSDLMEYTLEGDPVDQQGRSMYTERPIHGGIYQAREDVMAVVHNHSPTVIPFSVTNTPLRPMFHLGAIIGPELPVWDIRDNFQDTNMLVTNMDQGRDLARCLGQGVSTLINRVRGFELFIRSHRPDVQTVRIRANTA